MEFLAMDIPIALIKINFEKETEMKTKKFSLFVLVTLFILLVSACAPEQKGPAKAEVPVDKGYAEGSEIYYTHRGFRC